jgi:predicted nucleic acid-binding Zn ribbon protein
MHPLRLKFLEEWRGLPQTVAKRDRCAAVGDILQKLMPKLGLSEMVAEEQVREAWSGLVGDFLSRHAAPCGLSGGVLSIQVLQPSVRYELERHWKPKILAKLQERFRKKAIREIKFRLS